MLAWFKIHDTRWLFMLLPPQNNPRSYKESIVEPRYGAGKFRDIHNIEIFIV